MRIGGIELHLLSDGWVWVDAGGPFGLVPRALYARHFPPDSSNQVPMVLHCPLVVSEGKRIVIDTGLGEKLSAEDTERWGLERPSGGLDASLARLGYSTDDIDIVIDTHLHADHCGGNTGLVAGRVVPRFGRAEYLVQRMEWADASHPDARTRGTYFSDNFAPLMAAGKVRLLHGETAITSHVRCVPTPGHTRGHQSVLLESGDWRGLVVADLASYAVHLAYSAWLTAYDVLPLENIATKERWRAWAAARQAWVIFPHDPWMPVGRVERREGRWSVEKVPAAQELMAGIPTPPRPPG
jgi:glyoxylase-like metal-dependent hydrolase (beta-lactamase superfamily II)